MISDQELNAYINETAKSPYFNKAIPIWEHELLELRDYKKKTQDLEKKVSLLEKTVEYLMQQVMRDRYGVSDLEKQVSDFSLR